MSQVVLTPGRKHSVQEWAALPEDDSGELVDGAVVEEEMPSVLHEFIVAWLMQWLGGWAGPRGAMVLGSGVKARHRSRWRPNASRREAR